jgi:hypothetical protein
MTNYDGEKIGGTIGTGKNGGGKNEKETNSGKKDGD